jgi:hypothetical protein
MTRDFRGRFGHGNPGKQPGSRPRASLAAEALLDGETEALTRKAIELALNGDTVALRLCLDRIIPARKSRPVELGLPSVRDAQSAQTALAQIIAATANAEIAPDEAQAVAGLVESYRRGVELTDLDVRLKKLEDARLSQT